MKQFDWLSKSNDITASSNVCWLRFSWRGGWLAVPRGEGVSLLPRGSWDPARLLTCTTLVDKESFTTVSWRRDDTLLIAGTSKVCTQLEINELCVLQVSLGSFLVRPVFTVCWRWRNTWLSYQ